MSFENFIVNLIYILISAAPDGVKPPTLTSEDPRSIRAVWQSVGRTNVDQQPVYQLQFRSMESDSLIEE